MAPDPVQPQGTNWIISETTSPVDYTPQISALTMTRASSQEAPSSLAIRCRAHRTELVISATGTWKHPMEGDVKVVYRINNEPPVEERWKAVEAGKGLAFQGDAVRLLRSIPDNGPVVINMYAGKVRPGESKFLLAG